MDAHRYHHGDLRAALLEAAESRLRQRGISHLSLRDLAKAVGVSHAAPRRHFAERQDLLDALAHTGYARLGEMIRRELADESTDLAARLYRAASAFARFAVENPDLLEVMNAMKNRPGSLEVPRSSAATFAPIIDLIREGQTAGILHGGRPEELGLILYATMNGLAILVNTGGIGADRLDELTRRAVDQFLNGAS